MGKTHFTGPVYGGLGTFTIWVGDCAGAATTIGYLYIPDGYKFHLEKVVANHTVDTDAEASKLNLGPSSDTDGWVDNSAWPAAGTGQEMTINGTKSTTLAGADYIYCGITVSASDAISDAFVTLYGYLEEESPTGV